VFMGNEHVSTFGFVTLDLISGSNTSSRGEEKTWAMPSLKEFTYPYCGIPLFATDLLLLWATHEVISVLWFHQNQRPHAEELVVGQNCHHLTHKMLPNPHFFHL